MALKNLNNWLSLGLQLGLLHPTLKRIEKEQHGLINECKTEMLVAWLKRNDNVGVPCCAILKAALKKIDENQLASEINNLWVSLSLSVCHFHAYPQSTHTRLFTCILFLREIKRRVRARKLSSSMYNQNPLRYNRFSNNIAGVIILCCIHVCTHGCGWWIIFMLVVPLLLAVIFYLLYWRPCVSVSYCKHTQAHTSSPGSLRR